MRRKSWSKQLVPSGVHSFMFLRDDFFEQFLCSNLCIDGGYDICAEMYNKNILAPLKTFIPKVRPSSIAFYLEA
jgi:hypothetical protein